ncbi:hypothetical protein F5B20DRAFT_584666 [Whalleya microplaca]|nr:hypothetical protein F5B20DRAFT_584666 [Whalleya microplaca]
MATQTFTAPFRPHPYTPPPASPIITTAPPTAQFTPPPECLDPGNNWLVTTSCYANLIHSIATPDWLTCSVTHFGAPAWHDASCLVPLPTAAYEVPDTVGEDGETSYYAGCPVGYTAVASTRGPGWDTWEFEGRFDASEFWTGCCPSLYPFTYNTASIDPYRTLTTTHDGGLYTLNLYPLPACVATSLSQLSGSSIPARTWSNPMAWDRKRQDSTTSVSWDFERGTLFAHAQAYSYTVFRGTHTCWAHCSDWFTYYYPDGVGETAWPESTSTDGVGDGDGGTTSVETTTATEGESGTTGETPTETHSSEGTSPELPSSSGTEPGDTTADSSSDGSASATGSGGKPVPSMTPVPSATNSSSSDAPAAPTSSSVSTAGTDALQVRSICMLAVIVLSVAIAV